MITVKVSVPIKAIDGAKAVGTIHLHQDTPGEIVLEVNYTEYTFDFYDIARALNACPYQMPQSKESA